MEWCDEGVVLGVRRHGETSAIVEAMTRDHGRHLGLVRGGRSARLRPVLQPGNSVRLTWRARLSEHLGMFAVEAERLRAADLMRSGMALFGLQALADHLRLLPERDPHGGLYGAALVILDNLDDPVTTARLFIRFELALLEELGFGLDLTSCAATGQAADLAFVSPRSGRAVSREAGSAWSDRLLALPPFLAGAAAGSVPPAGRRDIEAGLALTGYFLDRDVWSPRSGRAPEARARLLQALESALPPDRANPSNASSL